MTRDLPGSLLKYMKRLLKVALYISFFSTLFISIISRYKPFWQPFEKRIYDLKYTFSISEEKKENIVIVDIDETSLQKLGRYQNWPRAYFAEVIDYLKDARVIGLDILFTEPDTLPTFAKKYYTKPSFDSLLESAIKNSGKVVLVSSLKENSIFSDICLTGIGEVIPDNDGVVRWGHYSILDKKTFAAQIAEMVNHKIHKGRFLIKFFVQGSFRTISFSDVYLKRIAREYFKDKIVLIGGRAPGLFDYHSVPFDRHFPGIEVQANLINNFINNLKITEIPLSYIILLTFIIAFLISFFTLYKPASFYLICCVIIYFLFGLSSIFLFSLNIELGIIRPSYTFIIAIIGSLIYRYQIEEKEKRKIKAIFSRYYSKELVEKVITNPPQLGGEKVSCTIIFADIRDFTTYAEKTSPELVGERLNSFLKEMVNIIFENQGRVDKFIGDCVMAVFGFPIQLKNHALNACLAAQDMVKRAADLGFKIGIGINSGEVISGNFGSPMRMEYTVIGDAVNLASRLEGLTKELSKNIIVSEFTYRLISSEHVQKFSFKDLGKVKVKGKEEEIGIYELQ